MATSTRSRRPASRRPATRRRAPARKPLTKSPLWALTRWLARWCGRGGRVAARWGWRRGAGHVRRVAVRTGDSWRLFAASRAEHGRTPFVFDADDGHSYDAHNVPLTAPTGGDAAVRQEQAHTAALQRLRREWAADERTLGPVRLSWWDVHVRRVDVTETRLIHEAAVMGVRARRAERMTAAADLFWPDPAPPRDAPEPDRPADPEPIDLDPPTGGPRRRPKGRPMSNTVRDWPDLADPGVDPFEFPEELPAHLAEVTALVTNTGGELGTAADLAQKTAAANFTAYLEYMTGAGVDDNVLKELSAANEAIDAAAAAMRAAAEQMLAAATLCSAAKRAADVAYGEWEMPRFDQVG